MAAEKACAGLPPTHREFRLSESSYMRKLFASIDSVLSVTDSILTFMAVLCLAAIGLLTTLDVAMRYLFHSPFEFAFDLTSMYLFPASVLLVLSEVFRKNENIDIDILSRHLPIRKWRLCSLVGNAAAFAIFATIAYLYIGKAVHAYAENETTFGAINWKTWPAMTVAAVGFLFLSISILFRSLQHLTGTSERPRTHELAD